MKRICFALMLILCMTFAGSASAQNDTSTTFTFAGLGFQGDIGFVFGTGQTFGRVTVVPFARFTLDSQTTDGLRFTKTFGAETIFWLYKTEKTWVGVIASVFNLDWLDNQEEPLGVYISQSAGLNLHWQIREGFALDFAAKAKTQLFAKNTAYHDRFALYVVAVTDKLSFLQLF